MRPIRLVACLIGSTLALSAGVAAASCRVANETNYRFTVSSGNVANQRIGPHVTTTIAPGHIQGRSDEGKTISGICKDGGDMVIREKNGVPLLQNRGGGGGGKKK